ncbi:MAG: T9SS type A sorting domain-containing protein [Bacteroidales bacterium]|nr:T9SS type A sorting domain-containing protein [Bacteroidales bacterium]
MKHFTLFIALFLALNTFGQITVTSSDMPVPGDTLRSSIAFNMDEFDFTRTGPDYNWNFTTLIPIEQRVDTFISVTDTPVSFWPFFLTSANLATSFNPAGLLPGLPSTEAYRFLKNSTTSYTDAGYGIIFDGTPLPLKFAQADEIYRFPMTYGQSWNGEAGLEIGLPDLGYLMIERSRENEIDGWGTLTTPFGTFEVLRYRSVVDEYDSVFIQADSIGLGIQRNYTEYHWLAKENGIPLLQVSIDEQLGATAIYRDSARFITVGLNTQFVERNKLSVYPNPVSNSFTVSYQAKAESQAELSLFDLQGILVAEQAVSFKRGENKLQLNATDYNLKPGIYNIRISAGNQLYHTKMVVVR